MNKIDNCYWQQLFTDNGVFLHRKTFAYKQNTHVFPGGGRELLLINK